MANKNIHVTTHPKGGWQEKKEGAGRASSLHRTQKDAIDSARKHAKQDKVEVVIHRRDGGVRDSGSFGNDPCPPKDKKH